jgi:hypothetical protein
MAHQSDWSKIWKSSWPTIAYKMISFYILFVQIGLQMQKIWNLVLICLVWPYRTSLTDLSDNVCQVSGVW